MSDTPIADMVERMLSGGIPPDMIVMAIRTAENLSRASVSEDATAARRRAWDREYRNRRRRNCPPDMSAKHKTHSFYSSPSVDLEIKKEEKKESVLSCPPDCPPDTIPGSNEPIPLTEHKKRVVGKICPPDFHPTEHHFIEGQELGHSRADVIAMSDDMKSWSRANANRAVARKADWNLTLTGWLRRNSKQKSNGGRNEHRGHSLAAAADDLIARAESFERENDLGQQHDTEPEFTIGQAARR